MKQTPILIKFLNRIESPLLTTQSEPPVSQTELTVTSTYDIEWASCFPNRTDSYPVLTTQSEPLSPKQNWQLPSTYDIEWASSFLQIDWQLPPTYATHWVFSVSHIELTVTPHLQHRVSLLYFPNRQTATPYLRKRLMFLYFTNRTNGYLQFTTHLFQNHNWQLLPTYDTGIPNTARESWTSSQGVSWKWTKRSRDSTGDNYQLWANSLLVWRISGGGSSTTTDSQTSMSAMRKKRSGPAEHYSYKHVYSRKETTVLSCRHELTGLAVGKSRMAMMDGLGQAL